MPTTAAGTLAQTSLANALVYIRSQRLTGAFDLWASGGRTLRMQVWRGLVVAIDGTADATHVRHRLHEAFALPPETTYTFTGTPTTDARPALTFDPLVAVWRAMLGAPATGADAARARIGTAPIALARDTDLAASDFPTDERAIVEQLASRPCTLAELREQSGLTPERVEQLVHLLVLARCAEPRTTTLPAPPPAPTTDIGDAPTLKVPKWRSFELSLVDVEEQLADVAPRPKPKSPAELGADGVRQRAARIAFETPYAALGLAEGASIEAARAAYVHASRAWHPHRLPPELEHVSAEAACVYMHIVEAYGSLADQNLAAPTDLGERPAHADGQPRS